MVYYGAGMGDQPETGRRRVSVAEAAEVLGVSVEAVRGRIKRGTLDSEREGDHVFVLLEAGQSRPAADRSTDQAQPDALLSAKEETIALLREQLEAERRANEENRRIIAALTSRIPAIEAPPEPSEAPTEAPEQPGRVERQPQVEGAQEAGARVAWWRRVFGG